MSEIKRKLKIQSKNYLKVLEIIKSENHEARLIGGVVRDSCLPVKSHDIDIATSMLPERVMQTFTACGVKVFPIGIEFGTVLILFKGEPFEITTLRKDISCDGRHAKVEYTDDFYLDAKRRDFTINALSYCPFEEIIYDYFNGLEDLAKGCVKFIGDPEERIAEDYLRILRFFRFHGRFGKDLDQESFAACIKHKSFLKKLSRERIKAEFDLILKLPNYLEVLMLGKEILPELFPLYKFEGEEEKRVFKALDLAEEISHKIGVKLGLEIKYAILLSGSKISLKELILLKFSKKEARAIEALLSIIEGSLVTNRHCEEIQPPRRHCEEASWPTWQSQEAIGPPVVSPEIATSAKRPPRNDVFKLKKIWLDNENFADFFILYALISPKKKEEVISLYFELKSKERPVFPINGNHIKSLGLVGGDIKIALSRLEHMWIESDFKLTEEELLNNLNHRL